MIEIDVAITVSQLQALIKETLCGAPTDSGQTYAKGPCLQIALREARRAPRVAGCLPVLRPLCPAGVGQPLLVHHENRRVGPADHFGGVENRFLHHAQMVRSASSAGCMVRGPAVARSWAL